MRITGCATALRAPMHGKTRMKLEITGRTSPMSRRANRWIYKGFLQTEDVHRETARSADLCVESDLASGSRSINSTVTQLNEYTRAH
jgi:hypothetical protein